MILSPLFADGMILQRDQEIKVFGWGTGKFTAEFLGKTAETEANGAFCVTFPAQKAGGPYEMRVSLDGEERVIRDIMIGEVILLAGQSNAELQIWETSDCDTVFPPEPNVRLFMLRRPFSDGKGGITFDDVDYCEQWMPLKTENARDWTALGLHIARYYAKKLGVAVGIVACYRGATAIQAFLSKKANADFPYDKEKLHPDHQQYEWNIPGLMYERQFMRVFPYPLSAVVWYQGESNRSEYEAEFYDRMLLRLIEELREGFASPALPFIAVQINRFPADCLPGVIAVRKAQERAMEQAEFGRLVRIDDMGEHDQIHPRNKRAVAERICAALDEMRSI